MKIIRHYRDLPAEARGAVVALGNFDGVHRGHKALIEEARSIAKETRRSLAALVFEPYPREFFRPKDEPFRLTPLHEKARLLAGLGVDFVIVLAFDAELAGKLAQDFVMDVLVGPLGVSHVVVGQDFQFGKGRGGDAVVLAYMGEMEDFGVTVFAPIARDGEAKISSSDIRAALKAGNPEEAAKLLGHWWRIEAQVAHGDKRGRDLGFPTANLKLDAHMLRPLYGVYAVRAHVDGAAHDGVANFGLRPMFELNEPLLEVHLFDFSGDLYGKAMSVDFIAYLRGEMKFGDLETLKAQMVKDSEAARRALRAMG